MRYALLLIFSAVAFGARLTSRTVSGERIGSGNMSASSAAALYSKNCASCHGRDGRAKTARGKLNHARDLTDPEWQGRVGDERIFNSIMNGKGKMPSYANKLSEAEIDSLVAYVRGLRK